MAIFDDFNSGSLADFWTSASNYDVVIAAGDGILAFNGGASQNLNPVSVGSGESRQITTRELDLTGNGTIDFDLLIGDSSTTPWGRFENADGGEDIILRYSIDGGASFALMQTFDTEAAATRGQFGSFSISPPAAAQTDSTILRWSQVRNSGQSYDHWALDNVKVNGISRDDVFATDDVSTIAGNVFADNGFGVEDSANPPIAVTEVNGVAVDVGNQITLASGAQLTLSANGDFTYIPMQESTPLGVTVTDSFSYKVQDGVGETDTATVTINVSGLDNDDVITGTAGDDILNGGIGNDTITGAAGDDIIDGGAGDDDLNGNTGFDTVSYASAAAGVNVDLIMQASAQNTSGAGIDTLNGFVNLQGSSFSDTLLGANNDNVLDGGAGADTMSGRSGDDLYLVDDSGDVIVELAGEGLDSVLSSTSYVLSAEVEMLALDGVADLSATGNNGDNSLIGNSGNNALSGQDGDDVLAGGEGADAIDGGNGTDRLEFGLATMGVAVNLQLGTGSAGEAAGDTYANIEEVFATVFDDIISGGTADEQVRGRAGNDVISGAGGNDVILGGSGDDVAQGGAGDDRLYGQRGDDRLTGGDMNDRLRGHEGNDVLSGGAGMDDLRGGVGDDALFGGGDNDFILGEFGADLIDAGDGNDQVRAGGSDDTVEGGLGDDRLYGQAGNDQLDGGDGDDRIRGNSGVDNLTGGEGKDDVRGGDDADTLFGGGATDYLFGGTGMDILIGGAGADSLTGGVGGGVFDATSDTFIYAGVASGGGGFDRIKDWEDGVDLINLTSFGFTDFASQVETLASNTANGLRIAFGSGDVLFVENFDLASFDAGDVIL